MPRVVKHPELRRTELLDLAMTLFLERGYERVSLNDLIATSGMSKGAFYHYFSSKEALVSALAARSADQAFEALRPVFEAQGRGALERLNSGLRAGYEVKMALGAPGEYRGDGLDDAPGERVAAAQDLGDLGGQVPAGTTEVIAQESPKGCSTHSIPRVGDMIRAWRPPWAPPCSASSPPRMRRRGRGRSTLPCCVSVFTVLPPTGYSDCPTARSRCWTATKSRRWLPCSRPALAGRDDIQVR